MMKIDAEVDEYISEPPSIHHFPLTTYVHCHSSELLASDVDLSKIAIEASTNFFEKSEWFDNKVNAQVKTSSVRMATFTYRVSPTKRHALSTYQRIRD